MKAISRLVNRMMSPLTESFVGRKPVETTFTQEWIMTNMGPAVYAHIHRPVTSVKHPGVVLVPGGLDPGSAFDKGTEVTADDIASFGFAVLHYDPSGRGQTGGVEDYWGPNNQRELLIVLDHFARHPFVSSNDIGIFSFSIGITISSGALARYSLPFIKYLFDWEGPSNRFIITQNDNLKLLKNFLCSDMKFWREREAARFIGKIKCGYFRYQAERDHVQGLYKGHAIELVNLATRGEAKWTKLNNNPPNMLFDENQPNSYRWIPWYDNHKGRLLKYLLEIQSIG